MLKHLSIDEEEIDDLEEEEEEEEEKDVPKEGMKWFALTRVHTRNYFSFQTFEQHMKVYWSPSKEVKIKALEPNLFDMSRGLA
jgi:hypothetical protein